MFVLDSHCDTPSQILKRVDPDVDTRIRGHVSYQQMKQGGVDACFFAMYIPKEFSSDEGFEYVRKMLVTTRNDVFENADQVRFAQNVDEALRNKSKGFVSIFLALENASPIGEDWSRLEWFHRQGVKYITLCHNADNQVCDSAAQATTHHGLSKFGIEFIHKLNELGIIVDCAHISDEAFYDVLKYSSKPVVSTHSCCRALCGHRRNMTDDMIRALAAKGGVIQINFYPLFLDDDPSKADIERVCDHIDHVVKLVGVDHVGIGSDFDGIDETPRGLENISKIPDLLEHLSKRGYSAEDIEKIAGGNFLRVMRACEEV